MAQKITQGTVAVIHFGPFLDKADGLTLLTGAGIIASIDNATTGIKISKNGGSLAVREQGANFVPSVYDAHGCFKVSLSAIDTGTLGRLFIIHTEPATYLPVWTEIEIVAADPDFGAAQKTSLNAATPASVQNIPATGSGFTALGDTRLANLNATVSSRSSHSAADVWAVSVRTLSTFGTLVADIAAAVWGATVRTLSAFGFNLGFATPTNVTDARDHIEAMLVTGGSVAGPGADHVTLTFTDALGAPIPDGDVWIDLPVGTTIAGTLQTNSAGQVIFLLDAGVTYYMNFQKDGEQSIIARAFVAVADP